MLVDRVRQVIRVGSISENIRGRKRIGIVRSRRFVRGEFAARKRDADRNTRSGLSSILVVFLPRCERYTLRQQVGFSSKHDHFSFSTRWPEGKLL